MSLHLETTMEFVRSSKNAFRKLFRNIVIQLSHISINMVLCASIGLVLGRYWQHLPATGT